MWMCDVVTYNRAVLFNSICNRIDSCTNLRKLASGRSWANRGARSWPASLGSVRVSHFSQASRRYTFVLAVNI